MWSGRALSEHIRECAEARRALETKVDTGFGEARRKIDERHEQNVAALVVLRKENQEAHARLYGAFAKAFWAVVLIIIANYVAAHGFTVGAVHP